MYDLRCKDMGFDCAGVVRGATKEAVLQQATAHAVQAHQTVVTPDMATKVLELIRTVDDEGGVSGGHPPNV